MIIHKNIPNFGFRLCRVWVERSGKMEAAGAGLVWVSLNTSSVTLWPAELFFLSCWLFFCSLAQQCNSWIWNVEIFIGEFVYKASSNELLCSCLLQWKLLYCICFRVGFFPRMDFFLLPYLLHFGTFVHMDIYTCHLVLSVKSMQKLPLI